MSSEKVNISEHDLSKIGGRILYIRKFNNLPQSSFSVSIGISKGNLSMLESNSYFPSYKPLVQIIEQYSINGHWLLTGDGDIYLKNSDDKITRNEFEEELSSLRSEIDNLKDYCNFNKKGNVA